jgi:hypothetical protein
MNGRDEERIRGKFYPEKQEGRELQRQRRKGKDSIKVYVTEIGCEGVV